MPKILGTKIAKVLYRAVSFFYDMGISSSLVFAVLFYNKIVFSLKEYFTFRAETVNVKIHEGELKGRKIVSVLGRPYFRFQGIPYAKPPLGPLRFKDPEPPEPWTGVRSALKEGNMCLQADIITGLTRGSEDCLFLNVFTPEVPKEGAETDGKAVMVWIHGGAFNYGSANAEIYGPDFFMEEDVVLVTLNYRLGVLGFLSTRTEDAPGNAGLKDVVMALKWVQRNIAAFGGDPKKVTIFGESAGGAAVHLLMFSPLAKGLFQCAISQSGSALCPWAMTDDPVETAFKLGRSFGLETKDPKVLVEYLKKISPSVLAKKQSVAIPEQNKRECIPLAFLPCTEPASYSNAFITELPAKLLEQKKIYCDVPYITGVNEMEGILMLKPIMDKLPPPEEIDKDFERLVPRCLNLSYGSDQSKAVAAKIREFYFHNKPFDSKTFKEYADLATDSYFLLAVNETTQVQSQFTESPIYNYQFMYEGDMGLLKKILSVKQIPGPVHADELGYLFHIPILSPSVDPKSTEMAVARKMVKLWTNFAKYKHPTPNPEDPILENFQWQAYSKENPCFLVIGEELSMGKNINEERLKFWKEIKRSLEGKGAGPLFQNCQPPVFPPREAFAERLTPTAAT